MKTPEVSILISSYKRLNYLRRTLYSIADSPPSLPYEVILADERSNETDDIIKELETYNNVFSWKLIHCNPDLYEELTGIKKIYNNPSWTNNVAFQASSGKYIFLQGNEVIAMPQMYDLMIAEAKELNSKYYIIYSTTFNMSKTIQDRLGDYGDSLSIKDVSEIIRTIPFQSPDFRAMVTNYCSLISRETWLKLEGFDTTYLTGIAVEDSDFSMRARVLPGFQAWYSTAISLHQDHSDGTTRHPQWDELVQKSRNYLNSWDGKSYKNRGKWSNCTYGVEGVVEHVCAS